MNERFNPIDEIGVSILKLCILQDFGWIPRSIRSMDMGIDMNIEQVINGKPTAKYISIQLKTGLGNIYEDKKGNYIFYFNETHYNYWLSSPIPVVLVLCDPDKRLLYWEQIRLSKIRKTPKGYAITINPNKKLDKSTIDDFNTLIQVYQSEFEVRYEDYESEFEDPDYWCELLHNCSEALSNSTKLFMQLDAKYQAYCNSMNEFLEKNKYGITLAEANKCIRLNASKLRLGIDVCRTQFAAQIPIIAKTHIEAIRLAETAILEIVKISPVVANLIVTNLNYELAAMRGTVQNFDQGVEQYKKGNSYNADLSRSERSFSHVLENYVANLNLLAVYIQSLIVNIQERMAI